MRMLIVLFYPRATEKTLLIYRSLSKKDLKYILCLIITKFIALHLIRDIGLSVVAYDAIYTAKPRSEIECLCNDVVLSVFHLQESVLLADEHGVCFQALMLQGTIQSVFSIFKACFQALMLQGTIQSVFSIFKALCKDLLKENSCPGGGPGRDSLQRSQRSWWDHISSFSQILRSSEYETTLSFYLEPFFSKISRT